MLAEKKGFFMQEKSSDYAMCGYIPQSMPKLIKGAQYKFDWWPAIGQNGAKEDDKVVFKFDEFMTDQLSGRALGDTVTGMPMSGKYRGKRFEYTIVKDTFKIPPAELKKHRLMDEVQLKSFGSFKN